MKKVVINVCFGGFGLSYKAVMRYAEVKGFSLYPWFDDITRSVHKDKAVIGNDGLLHHYSRVPIDGLERTSKGIPKIPMGAGFYEGDIERDDPALIQVVEEMSKVANGKYADLKVVEIPDGVEYTIEAYDGNEHIAENHRTWS